ncbi:transaldolase [Xylaria acuta]|nr:transaldolase [Xylaria acuta]
MSMKPQTLLDLLRTLSAVDCDSLGVEVAKQLGPFVDCTSNQAIAHHELSKTDAGGKLINYQLIMDSIAYSKSKTSEFYDVHLREVATNPKDSFNTQKTVSNARRFVAISKDLDPNFDITKLCIKIPATWEGIQACKELQSQGIATLATAISSMQQTMLASHVGCTYIGLYINELRVHFDESYVDDNKSFHIYDLSQRFYQKHGQRTQVITASLISIDEVMILAGADHITIAPSLLRELSKTPTDSWKGAVGSVFQPVSSEAQDVGGAVSSHVRQAIHF